MRNMKIEHGLTGSKNWPHGAVILIPGDPTAQSIPANLSESDKEDIIQGWQRVAVLQVTNATRVQFGFVVGSHFQILSVPVELNDSQFGVRIGPENSQMLLFPEIAESNSTQVLKAELIEVVDIDDPRYNDLPLY